MSRWTTFDRIWAKGKQNKMVQRLMAKCVQRKIEPTEDNCRDYWMGYIRFYKDSWSGKDYHVNPRKNKILMKTLKRNKYENKPVKGNKYDNKRRKTSRRKSSR